MAQFECHRARAINKSRIRHSDVSASRHRGLAHGIPESRLIARTREAPAGTTSVIHARSAIRCSGESSATTAGYANDVNAITARMQAG